MSMDLENTPVLPPPPGHTSNFVDPESRATVAIYFAVTVPAIALLFVCARIYSQITFARRLHLDDYLSVSAMCFSIVFAVLAIVRTPYGFGRHMWDVPLVDFEPFMKVVISMACIALGMVTTAKLSILFFYRRIFGADIIFHRIVTGAIVFVFLYCLGYFFGMVFNCVPVEKNWAPATPGHCGSPEAVVLASAIFNLLTDVFILALPLPIIWNLRLAPRLKIGLSLIFALGGGTVALSAVRLWAMQHFSSSPDASWNIITLDITSFFEFNSLIICGCLPILKPLLQKWFPSLLPEALFGKSATSPRGPGSPRRSMAPSNRYGKRWAKMGNISDTEPGLPSDKESGTSSPPRCSSDAGGLVSEDQQHSILRTMSYAVKYPAEAHTRV